MAKSIPASFSSPASHPLDPARISGISAALAVHLVALGLLAMPTRPAPAPAPTASPDERVPFVFHVALPPPPMVPTPIMEITRRPPSRTQPPTLITPPPPSTLHVANLDMSSDAPVIADRGEAIPLPSAEPSPPLPPGSGDGPPASGIALQYRLNPPPAYPREALRDGLQGTVMLRVLVDEAGNPLEVSIERGSGHRLLDRAAREQVLKHWKFVPATKDGHPIRAIGHVPVDFVIGG
ncbi:energy transducer TonB [Lysobacter pythonis]|uniref:Energy transducer TonB n=1 Tax=Solilutibacter pythonis TaxID=2483112 RepID=A0A3M2HYC3_9GAMM|nr:energy transducer TonB [Lysobacter pythonis]RMH91177.1 energy transducer TonB [Lysobacter pythonis]